MRDHPGDAGRLIELLDVQALGGDAFAGPLDTWFKPTHPFGGQSLAQALRAAAATIGAAQFPHSLHAYFIRAANPAEPIVYSVDRLKDGRGYSTRQVTASQQGRTTFLLTASFHQDEDGVELFSAGADPLTSVEPPSPDDPRWQRLPIGLDVLDASVKGPPAYTLWARASGPLPADRALHACALAYLSDLAPGPVSTTAIGLPPASLPVSVTELGATITSLDHSIWFHRPIQADAWLRVESEPVIARGGRGLVTGRIYDVAGALVASTSQELLIRSR